MSAAPIRLLFVDNHPVVATGLALRYGATPGFAVVGTTASVVETCRIVGDGGVDIVLLDLHLDLTVTPRQVTLLRERARVVLFSAHAGDAIVTRLLAAGAATAVDKATPLPTLDAILRDVSAGWTARIAADRHDGDLARGPPLGARARGVPDPFAVSDAQRGGGRARHRHVDGVLPHRPHPTEARGADGARDRGPRPHLAPLTVS